MCLILFALNPNPDCRLIVAANRDEFHARSSLAAAFWEENPDLLAGRDRKAGGTWLGITRSGRFAAVTNLREPEPKPLPKGSRGHVTLDYLQKGKDPKGYLQQLQSRCGQYRGFNLLAGDLKEADLFYLASRKGEIRRLTPGVYGLSNQLLDCDWPKVQTGREQLRQMTQKAVSTEALLELLTRTGAQSQEGEESIAEDLFITGETYGTVASTALIVRQDGQVQFSERRWSSRQTVTDERNFQFRLG